MAPAGLDDPLPLLRWPNNEKRLRSNLSSIRTKPADPETKLDGDSSSSSCFTNADGSTSTSANARKRLRREQREEPRPITRLYAKKLQQEEEGTILDLPEPQSRQNDEIASVCASDLTVSGADRRSDAAAAASETCSTSVAPEAGRRSADRDPGGLECSEMLSGGSEYSTCNEMTLSEFESELFGNSEEGYCLSDSSRAYATSESSGSFSEGSRSPVAKSFSLFRELWDQFLLFPAPEAPADRDHDDDFILLRFEDEEDEVSYRAFRSWERRIAIPEKCAAGERGAAPVLQERLLMVRWIVEHSNAMQLQNETFFLGVNLMDRFLRRGYFETKKNLHLLGIACVTLATRIQENQPYNNVRRRMFLVGDHTFTRSEVVAMEWIVQRVLNFQCFHPTIYNFLWFYLKAARADAKVEGLAKYLAVMCLLDHDHLRFWPSSVAAGLVVLASLAKDCDESCQWVMETHVRTRNDDLPECIKSLEWLVKHAAC